MKLERNAPCPCGSGKKYKKCCYIDTKKNANLLRALSLAETEKELQEFLNRPPQAYRLKVTLKSMNGMEMDEEISRTFEIEDDASLYDFHRKIQRAFDWDNDHMFSFFLSDDWNEREHEYSANPLGIHMPRSFGPSHKSASDTELRDLGLKPGRTFWYLFDYGSELIHQINVESMRNQEEDEHLPRVVAEVGTPSLQYGDWEDEDDGGRIV